MLTVKYIFRVRFELVTYVAAYFFTHVWYPLFQNGADLSTRSGDVKMT